MSIITSTSYGVRTYAQTEPGEEFVDLRSVAKRFVDTTGVSPWEFDDDDTEDQLPAEDYADDEEWVRSVLALAAEVDESDADNEPLMIHEDYFVDYAKDLAVDTGCFASVMEIAPWGGRRERDLTTEWPFCHIDWEAAAEALRADFEEIDFGGETYYRRPS